MAPSSLGLVYLASEVVLRFTRKSSGGTADATDRSTLRLLWITILVSLALGITAASSLHVGKFYLMARERLLCEALFWAGLLLRWWAIVTLGRFFTVDVTIQRDHRLVTHGLYRWVRHPSYTGMMLAFLGFALTLQNAFSVALIILPISLALARRIQVEEAVLSGAFGEEYRRYRSKTKRLLPGIY